MVFHGESSPKTARGLAYVAVDMAVPEYRKLNQLVIEGGFPHHLAVALADVSAEARMLCTLLGITWVSPDADLPTPKPETRRATLRKAGSVLAPKLPA